MVQLRVKNNMPGGNGGHVFLDLYENDPIRVNLSIEDLRDTAPTSMYSQSFRVPDTPTNNLFFRSAFSVNSRDFNVTVTHAADLMVNGNIFKKGSIRLIKVYSSYNESLVEYELLFVGEARTLSTAIGSKTLNDLTNTELNHFMTYANISTSWEAEPNPDSTEGLFNGNVIYPLIHFGNNYNNNNIVTDTRISNNGTSNYFVNPLFALNQNRFKPMVRARWLFEEIFKEAGFTVKSSFFDTPDFMKLYVSAFGNDGENALESNTASLLTTFLNNEYQLSPDDREFNFNVALDPGSNFQEIPFSIFASSNPVVYENGFGYKVTAPGTYTVEMQIVADIVNNSGTVGLIYTFLTKLAAADEDGTGYQVDQYFGLDIIFETGLDVSTYASHTITFTQQDIDTGRACIVPHFISASASPNEIILKPGTYFKITETPPSGISIPYLLDNKYKQIDFIKDIMTTFRLVIEPSKEVENEFNIEPWNFYIGSGQIHDWTKKIDDSKDTQVEPLFYEQPEVLTFTFEEDGDWLNDLNIKQFNEPFGTLRFDSTNDLLTGSKEYKVKYAPTPVTQIDGTEVENDNFANLVIPHIYTKGIQDNLILNEPVRPKTRLLFWNGMVNNNVEGFTNGEWYVLDDNDQPVAQTQYPRVSPYADFPLSATTRTLNWQREFGYVNYANEIGYSLDLGLSLYDVYWSKYINLLYDPWSRKVTLTIKLNSEDLSNFNFSDLISIKGTYYYVSKINNLTLNDDDFCTVELIKFNSFRLPPIGSGDQLWNTWGEVWDTTSNIWGQF